ncbi:MAG: hypothetical protein JO359_00825 [Candidatus Eremiobacteraeota bacterium]|nr:hypothetical protein [Candidatus Eremiobacteraeota bacterium]
MIASAVLIGAGYVLWQNVEANLHLPVIYLSLSCYVFGFALAAAAFLAPEASEWIAVGALAYAFLAVAGAIVKYKVAFYGTDALLFNAYSARLLLEGVDPYTKSMEAAYAIFNAPQTLVTPTAQGLGVYVESYPALSFLLYVPFIAAHAHNVLWISVAAHLAAILILAWAAPPGLRAIFPLVLFVAPSYLDYTVGGVTDILWVPAMMLCAWYWNRSPWSAAIWLGIACAFKQTPWLVVPFALIFWMHVARIRRDVFAFLVPAALAFLAFALPNLPFALWHPTAWLHGITEPMSGGLISFGSGLVQFTTSNAKDWQPELYQRLSLGAFALLLVLYAWQWRRLSFLPFLAPAVVLFLAPRSLQNYFMYWPPVLLVFLASPRANVVELAAGRKLQTRWIVAVSAALVVVATSVGIARAQRERLSVELLDAKLDPGTQQIDALHVNVRNAGPQKTVRFLVYVQGEGTYVRLWDRGLATKLPEHATTTVWLSAGANANEIAAEGDTSVQVVALDPDNGTETFSNARTFVGGLRTLANAELRSWSEKPPYVPSGWTYDPRDFTSGVLRRARAADGASVLAYALPKATDATWHVAAVSQRVTAAVRSFRVRLRPGQDYAGDVYPRAIFGIELIDALGRHIDFTIDSRLSKPKVYRRDLFTYVVVPGKLNAWNDLLVDLTPYGDRLLLAPSSTLSFNVIAAVHASAGTGISAEFGGVRDFKTMVGSVDVAR